VTLLNAYQFHISCSRRGNPYDNAFCESFMKTLKSNEVDLTQYESILDVVTNVSKFIDEIYNNERVHSKIGYLTPIECDGDRDKAAINLGLSRATFFRRAKELGLVKERRLRSRQSNIGVSA